MIYQTILKRETMNKNHKKRAASFETALILKNILKIYFINVSFLVSLNKFPLSVFTSMLYI